MYFYIVGIHMAIIKYQITKFTKDINLENTFIRSLILVLLNEIKKGGKLNQTN